jgi:hypothetical protein
VALEAVYRDLNYVMQENNAMMYGGGTFCLSTSYVGSRSTSILNDLNLCCGEDNVRINGRLPSTIHGLDMFNSNRRILTQIVDGKELHYIIVGNKKANGFLTAIYDMMWHDRGRHWILMADEVHGSYVTHKDQIAVAVVTFE